MDKFTNVMFVIVMTLATILLVMMVGAFGFLLWHGVTGTPLPGATG